MPNKIILKSYSDHFEEYEAAATITPGMLVELTSAGKVQPHSSAGQNALIMFALANEFEGENIDTNYASGDMVRCWIPQRGDEVYAVLADDNSVTQGSSFLESNGAGYLQLHSADTESWEASDTGSITVYPNQIIAQSLETKDLTADSSAESSASPIGVNKRLKVRVV